MTHLTTIAIIASLFFTGVPTAVCCESHGFVSMSIERKVDGYWLGEYPATFQAGYRFRVSDQMYVAPVVSHYSNWELGWPAGEKYEAETWANTFGVEIEGRF